MLGLCVNKNMAKQRALILKRMFMEKCTSAKYLPVKFMENMMPEKIEIVI